MKKTTKTVLALSAAVAVMSASAAVSFAEYDPDRPIDPSQPIMATKSVEAADTITVNGNLLPDVTTYVSESGNVMIPIRAVAEALDFEVEWDNGNIALVKLPVYMTFSIGVDGYTFARTAPMPLGQAPELTDEKTYVPLSFFTDIMDAKATASLNGTVISYGEENADNDDQTEGEPAEGEPAEGEPAEGETNTDDLTVPVTTGIATIKDIAIDEEHDLTVVTVEDEIRGEIVLNIGKDTEIVKGEEILSVSDLTKDMKISIEYGAAMTMSLPPQNNPVKITILEELPDPDAENE